MENEMASLLALAVATMTIILNASSASADITCQDALLDVMPCEPFLASSGPPTPSIPCCGGVRKVNAQATATRIRRSLCVCFKKAASAASSPPDPKKLKQLPRFCKVSLMVPLDPSIDCSRISVLKGE